MSWQPTGGIDGGAVSFSGANGDSFVTSDFSSISGTPFTMSVWVKTTSTANDTMVYLGNGSTGNSYNTLKIQGGSARAVIRNTSEIQATGPSVRNGEWHHVVGVYNGTDSRELYVDGKPVNSSTIDVDDVTLTRFGIGALTRSTPLAPVDLFTGDLDEVALWDRAFNEDDVVALNGLVHLGAGNSANLEAFMAAFDSQSTVTVRGVDWEYVTEIPGEIGTASGSVSGGDAAIVLTSSGEGMRMVGAADPIVSSFTADHSSIVPGVPVTLTWQIFNADNASISQLGAINEQAGTLVVNPTTTTTYTLYALNSEGSDQASVTVTVANTTADPRISEFLAKNDDGLLDEDNDRPDWIEIHNDSGFALDLSGYKLTNDALVSGMWSFPSRILGQGERLVIFASGKNRLGAELHTNFTLDANGSYLALVRPNGATIVQEFSPAFPPQISDISYSSAGFHAKPTPGEMNDPGASGGVLQDKVNFDTMGGLYFDGAVNLVLSHPNPSATIRYTLDGSLPDATSTPYTAPISISTTTLVKAGAFQSNFVPGPLSQEGYIFADNELRTFESELPILVIDTFNTQLVRYDKDFKDATFAAFEPQVISGRTSLSDPGSESGNSGIHYRGESSQLSGFNKLNFAFETRNAEGQDKDIALMGMPEGSDWALHASEIDRTFIREQLPHRLFRDLGRYSPRTRPIEVFYNDSGGAISQDDYRGIYILVERIRRSKDRVDISKLEPNENTAPDITGGFIFKSDKSDPGDVRVSTPNAGSFAITYPKEGQITNAQKDYLQNYLREFEIALEGPSFADPNIGYAAYIDVDSWIDMHVIQELAKEVDSYRFSTFYYKDQGGKIVCGPLWDYDRSFGNVNSNGVNNPEGWWGGPGGTRGVFWERLFEDPNFEQLFIDRWQELMDSTLSKPYLNTLIDQMAAEVNEAKDRNFQPSGGPWPLANVTRSHLTFPTYAEHVDYLRDWLGDRLDWVAREWTDKPTFEIPPGNYNGMLNLTLNAPTGAIYYTTNGTDPRASGGGISGASYSGAIPITSTTQVTARALDNGVWSGPLEGSFIFGEPASAANFVISEIMYHPSDPTSVEISAGFTDEEDFEYLEFMNIGNNPIELADVVLSEVFDFTFPVYQLAPGDRILLVKNQAAFQFRYGNGLPVIGEYGPSNLKNSGERIVMTAANLSLIVDFSYLDSSPWPLAPDGGGSSLQLINPTGNPDHSLAIHWRSGGSPGHSGTSPFTGSSGDELLSYALITPKPQARLVGNELIFQFVASPTAEGVEYHVETSTDLQTWQRDAIFLGEVDLGTGTFGRKFSKSKGAEDSLWMRVRIEHR
ncbi:MAG: CotH kinase family protein [Akkermansiaceae bacterium]